MTQELGQTWFLHVNDRMHLLKSHSVSQLFANPASSDMTSPARIVSLAEGSAEFRHSAS